MRDKTLCITCKYGSRFTGDTSGWSKNPDNIACMYSVMSGKGTAVKRDGTDMRGDGECALYEKYTGRRKKEWRWWQ